MCAVGASSRIRKSTEIPNDAARSVLAHMLTVRPSTCRCHASHSCMQLRGPSKCSLWRNATGGRVCACGGSRSGGSKRPRRRTLARRHMGCSFVGHLQAGAGALPCAAGAGERRAATIPGPRRPSVPCNKQGKPFSGGCAKRGRLLFGGPEASRATLQFCGC